VDPRTGIEGQESLARLYGEGSRVEIRPDPSASDGSAARMPGDHKEWAFQIPIAELGSRAGAGRWNIYAVVRVEADGPPPTAEDADPGAVAFTAGVYDRSAKQERARIAPLVADLKDGYASYLLGAVDTNKDQTIWVAPAANESVRAVWVDRVYLVPAGQ
jgi:hypothetical protein